MVKINDVKVLILSTFDGVELMTGKYFNNNCFGYVHIVDSVISLVNSLQRFRVQRLEQI